MSQTQHNTSSVDHEQPRQTLYEQAESINRDRYLSRVERWFIDELTSEFDLGPTRVAEIFNYTPDDAPLRVLLVDEDGTRLFVGADETAYRSNGLFAFSVTPGGDYPSIRTCEEAIELITPVAVREAELEGLDVKRQGEWFLIPTDAEPDGEVFKGGVSERPFGLSPLVNHVPREYGFGAGPTSVIRLLESYAPEVAEHCDTAQDAISQLMRGWKIEGLDGVDLETDLPTVSEFTTSIGSVLVRGTVRHRENDHYMSRLGEQWHRAVTHDVEVYTADTASLRDTHAPTTVRRD